MKRTVLTALILTTALAAPLAQATDYNLGVGYSDDDNLVLRAGISEDFGQRWWQTDTGAITGYWDLTYTYWDGDIEPSNHSLAITPMFVYQFNGDRWAPFVEAGIGAAVFAHTRMEDNDLGSAFQFEDRIGAGIHLDSGADVGIRLTHYSNAGLWMPNEGTESLSLFYRSRF